MRIGHEIVLLNMGMYQHHDHEMHIFDFSIYGL